MTAKRFLAPLRWSVINTFLFPRTFARTGQFGDGREAAVAEYVIANARRGDIDDVLDTMDRFAYDKTFLISVGDRKGALLDAAVKRAGTRLALELGTYCGYGAMRIARAAPDAQVFSVESSAANAEIARRIWAHAGLAERITCVVGMIGDGGRTLAMLADYGFTEKALDLLFLDHVKIAYLPDLHSIMERGWLHPGSIVVADNVRIPGAPKYREYMRQEQGKRFDTIEHDTYGEYQSVVRDLMLESVVLG
jgi:catechol O-methyltransferase